jgi:hypothetical protein
MTNPIHRRDGEEPRMSKPHRAGRWSAPAPRSEAGEGGDSPRLEIDRYAMIDVVPVNGRRQPREYVTWQVVETLPDTPWLPGDRFTLYRVGRTNTLRLEHAPVAVNRLQARFGDTFMPMMLLLHCVCAGAWVALDGSTLQLVTLPASSDRHADGAR